MHSRNTRFIASLSSILALGAATTASMATPLDPAQHNRAGVGGLDDVVVVRHLKDAVTRPLDVTRIAAVVDGASRPRLMNRLAELGLDAQATRELDHGGIVLIDLPIFKQTPEAVRAEVARLLEDPDLAWAGPVLLDERGGAIIPLPEIFAGFADEVTPVQAAAIVADLGIGEIVQFDRQPGNIHLVLPAQRDGFAAIEAANALADHPLVKWAECDAVMRGYPALVPSDPGYSNQWFHHNTGAGSWVNDIDVNTPAAWDLELGLSSLVVAILDDGVQQNHPDINQLTPGYDATSQAWLGFNGGPIFEFDKHGTAVAGLVSGKLNNGLGGVGACPSCRVLAVKVAYDTDAAWGWTTQGSWLADGIYEAQSRGAEITNSSFVIGSSGTVTTAYTATSGAMLHIAAAGNDSDSSLNYPSSLGAVQAVAAIDPDGTLTWFSNWGSGLDFAAPGIDLYTTDRTGSAGYASGDYTWFDGTSGASPVTAGVAALIWASKPSQTPGQVLAIMQQTAKNLGVAGYDTTYGYGIPRAYEGVVEALFGSVCPGSGSCYESNGTPGCSGNNCCMTVCPTDPFCCTTSWDGLCASAAVELCAGCGTAGAGTCFASNGSPGCQSSACCSSVCAIDSYCCNTSWDGICAGEAWDLCTPESDVCSGAITLTTGVSYGFNTDNANTDGLVHALCDQFGDDQIHKDIWFKWTATCGGYMTVSTCNTADFDTKIAVYGQSFFGLTCPGGILGAPILACNDDFGGCSGNTSQITLAVEQGETYRIRVGGWNGASGEGSILVTCGIPNNTCADALEVFDGNTFVSTVGAATDGPTITCGTLNGAMPRDVWFRYVATCTGPLTVSTCGTADFDTMIGVWGPNFLTGASCPGTGLFGGALLGCNDDSAGCADNSSTVTVNVVAGKSYRIQLGGWGNQTGHATMNIHCGAPCPADVDGNGVVNGADLGLLLGQWGVNGSADLNDDNIVNGADLGLMLGAWGGC